MEVQGADGPFRTPKQWKLRELMECHIGNLWGTGWKQTETKLGGRVELVNTGRSTTVKTVLQLFVLHGYSKEKYGVFKTTKCFQEEKNETLILHRRNSDLATNT